MKEIWKDIDNYGGSYKISNKGRVKSLGRRIKRKNDIMHRKERILKPIMFGKYHGVQLYNNKSYEKFYIHRLVATYFLKTPVNEKYVVNHIDRDRFNNAFTNLEWCSQSFNVRSSQCKISDKQIIRISKMIKAGKCKNDIALKEGVKNSLVANIASGRKYSYLTKINPNDIRKERIIEVIKIFKSNLSAKEIAIKFNVTEAKIYGIKSKREWSWLTDVI